MQTIALPNFVTSDIQSEYKLYMYLYSDLVRDLAELAPHGRAGHFGHSVFGKELPYFVIGSGQRVLIHGGIHAREWVTTVLVMGMIRACIDRPPNLEICFVPCVNPDGCDIAQTGTSDRKLIEINGGNTDFSLWKANGRAVDLNTNFDANWGTGASNVRYPAPANYIGQFPLSEPETKALASLTEIFMPHKTISYHAMGREVYWEFFQTVEARERDLRFANLVANALSYARIDGDLGSAGGYKDWCIQSLKIPSVTVEIIGAPSTHPLNESDLAPDYQRNIELLYVL